MKSISFCLISIAAFSFAGTAQARINCNHDLACQAQRDGTTVADLKRRDSAMTACLRTVGYTLEDWHAYRVPAGPAGKVRSCFARHGLPTN